MGSRLRGSDRFVWMCVLAFATSAANAQQPYPTRPIRIVTAQPGSGNDILARLIAQGATPSLGQQVIVDNRGSIALEIVQKSTPDGYNLLLYGSVLWLLPFMRERAGYEPLRDFAPVLWGTTTPNVLVIHPSLPVKTVQDLVALAKAKPGELNYGSGSSGSTSHLAAELFKSMAGVNLVRIGYKGSGPAMTALLTGEFHLIFPSASTAAPMVKSGKVKAIAVASLKSTALAPGLPTLSESGLPGFESSSILGVFAAAKTPNAIVERLHQEFARALREPVAKERLFNVGVEAIGGSPQQLTDAIKSEMTRYGKVIRDAGIRDM